MFFKKKKQPKMLERCIPESTEEEIVNICKEAARYLKISMPQICFYSYVFSNETVGQGICDDTAFGDDKDIKVTDITGAIYLQDKDTILVTCLHPLTHELMPKNHLLASILHELRHVWQYTYEPKRYYGSKNAITEIDHLTDESEIDADAFAMYYSLMVLDNKNEDIPEFIQIAYKMDGGKRLQRIADLRRRGKST